MSRDWRSASELGLCSCPVCGLVLRLPRAVSEGRCPRCCATLEIRKPNSIGRCWAFLIAAYVLYVPANFLPIMDTGSLFDYRKDTIMSGVVHLWKTGSWMIATVVFCASIVIPLVKLISLSFLLVSVQRHSNIAPRQRTRLYRLLELVGRWSMLDIYVVSLLAALVQLSPFAVVKAGPGAIAFGAVVILTMYASQSFDPRLIWDAIEKGTDIHD